MFYFPNFLLSQTLIAMNMETSFTLVMFGAAVLSLCGNSLFIPSHGAQAAVWARLSIELLMTLSFLTILYLHARRQEVTSGLWARSFAIKTPQR
jgi:O-antigen/teichoic acid export membrane protein